MFYDKGWKVGGLEDFDLLGYEVRELCESIGKSLIKKDFNGIMLLICMFFIV